MGQMLKIRYQNPFRWNLERPNKNGKGPVKFLQSKSFRLINHQIPKIIVHLKKRTDVFILYESSRLFIIEYK